MKPIYINLVPIVKGGGLQNAINFLLNLDIKELNIIDFSVVLRNDRALIDICKDRGFEYSIINNTFLARLKYELIFFFGKNKSIIFTLFGTKPVLTWGAKTITGCAFSNLFYPKIDFWIHLTPIGKMIKKVKDLYRLLNVRSSDVVIFETELLRKKAVEEFSFSNANTFTIKMAVSSLVEKGGSFIDFNIQKNKFNILYLASAQPNKRQHLLPEIVKNMLTNGLDDFCFFLTIDEKNNYAKEVLDLISEMELELYIINLGSIESQKVAALIEQCDAMINIARLESFSNNFVEAWQMEKVLFVTDDEWAKDSCGAAAVYLDVEHYETITLSIKNIMENKKLYTDVVKKGIKQLDSYPHPKEKIAQFVEIINNYRRVR